MGAFPDGKQKECGSVPFGLLGVAGKVGGYPGSCLLGRRRKCTGPVNGLQHIHELLRSLRDRKVFVVDHNELADGKRLGKL